VDWQELNTQLDREFACEHAQRTLRVQICSNGTKQWKWQCDQCGQGSQAVSKSTLSAEQMAAASPVDEGLTEAWYARRRARQEELTQAARAQMQTDYAAYLQTPWWGERSSARLELDGYECQAQFPGCARRASQVHHRSYQEAPPYREPLFALVSVCRNCHEWIHGLRGGDS